MKWHSMIGSIVNSAGVKVSVDYDDSGRVVKEVFKPKEGAFFVRKLRDYEDVAGQSCLTTVTFKLFESDPVDGPLLRWVEELDVLTNTTTRQTAEEYKIRKGTLEDIPTDNKQARRISRDITRLRSQVESLRKQIKGLERKLADALAPPFVPEMPKDAKPPPDDPDGVFVGN